MNRARVFTVGACVPLLVVAGVTGAPVFVLLLAPVLLVGLVWTLRSGRAPTESRWSTATSSSRSLAGPTACPRSGSLTLVRSLGRAEARQLFWSPWFAIGLGFSAVTVLLFGFVFSGENTDAWAETMAYTPWLVHPLVGMTVLASHRSVTRATRDHTDEVFDVCPMAPETRTLGLVAASWLPTLAAAVFLLVLMLVLAWRAPLLHGPLTSDSPGDLVGAVVLGAGGVALGVALGRWVRFALAPVVVVVAIAFATPGINGIGGRAWNPYTNLTTAPAVEMPSPVFADRPVWSHALWITSLTALVVVAAVARHRRDRVVVLAGVAGLLVAGVAAFGATREMPSEAATRIADLVAHPEDHQECVEVGGRAQVCSFELHEALAERVAAEVAGVATALPRQVGLLVMRQRYDGRLDQLPPEVRRHLPGGLPARPAGELLITTDVDTIGNFSGPRRDLAKAAVGLPTAPDGGLLPIVVSGQARGVVALWLSVQGLDLEQQLRRTTIEGGSDDPFEQGSLDGVGPCSVPSVVWSAQDLAATRAILRLEHGVVARVLEAEWSRWTDPTTSTDELLATLGLPPAGPYDQFPARPGEPC